MSSTGALLWITDFTHRIRLYVYILYAMYLYIIYHRLDKSVLYTLYYGIIPIKETSQKLVLNYTI